MEKRIVEGFTRIGIAFGAIGGILVLGCFYLLRHSFSEALEDGYRWALTVGMTIYILFVLLAWVVTGFLPNSPSATEVNWKQVISFPLGSFLFLAPIWVGFEVGYKTYYWILTQPDLASHWGEFGRIASIIVGGVAGYAAFFIAFLVVVGSSTDDSNFGRILAWVDKKAGQPKPEIEEEA